MNQLRYFLVPFVLLSSCLIGSLASGAEQLLVIQGRNAYSANRETGGFQRFGSLDQKDGDLRPWRVVDGDDDTIWGARDSEVYEIDVHTLAVIRTLEIDANASILARNAITKEIIGAPRGRGPVISIAEDGTFTEIGSTDRALDAMGFDENGVLYGASGSDLLRIDPNTAEMEQVGTMEGVRFLNGFAVDPNDNRFLAVGFGFGLDDYSLYEIDKSNAAVTRLGDTVIRPAGLAFVPIPEPTAAFLGNGMLLGLLLLHRRMRVRP